MLREFFIRLQRRVGIRTRSVLTIWACALLIASFGAGLPAAASEASATLAAAIKSAKEDLAMLESAALNTDIEQETKVAERLRATLATLKAALAPIASGKREVAERTSAERELANLIEEVEAALIWQVQMQARRMAAPPAEPAKIDEPASELAESPPPPETWDRRPYFQRIEERLAELEPGELRKVQTDVRLLLARHQLAESYDLARRALDAAHEPQVRQAILALVLRLESASTILTHTLTRAPDLVGTNHVFRLGSGTEIAAEVIAFEESAFTITTADGAIMPLTLSALSPLGLVQIATSGSTSGEILASAASLFMILGDLTEMDRYLELARRRGELPEDLEVAALIAHEIEILHREAPAARATFAEALECHDEFIKSMDRRDYRHAINRVRTLGEKVRDEDLLALDDLTHERARVGLSALLEEARRSCTVEHQDRNENLVVCTQCEGDGLHTKLRDPVQGRRLGADVIECSLCGGRGLTPCQSCAFRFTDPAVIALLARIKEATKE